jgi:hypothetical protein
LFSLFNNYWNRMLSFFPSFYFSSSLAGMDKDTRLDYFTRYQNTFLTGH